MKVKLYVISGLLLIFSMVQVWASNSDLDDQTVKTNLIKLPSSKILKRNIKKTLGDTNFLEKTQLHTQLGEASKSLKEIDLAIDLAVDNYIDTIKNVVPEEFFPTAKKIMYGIKFSLRKAILPLDQNS